MNTLARGGKPHTCALQKGLKSLNRAWNINKKSSLERLILHECGLTLHFLTVERGAFLNCFSSSQRPQRKVGLFPTHSQRVVTRAAREKRRNIYRSAYMLTCFWILPRTWSAAAAPSQNFVSRNPFIKISWLESETVFNLVFFNFKHVSYHRLPVVLYRTHQHLFLFHLLFEIKFLQIPLREGANEPAAHEREKVSGRRREKRN